MYSWANCCPPYSSALRILILAYFQENAIKSNIHNKFSAYYDAVEAELKSSTVGGLRKGFSSP